MKDNAIRYVYPLLIGIFGTFVSSILMNSFSKPVTFVLVGLVYVFMGLYVGRMGLRKFWLGWLLLAAPALVSYAMPVVTQFELLWTEGRTLLSALVLMAVVPLPTSLAGAYWGRHTLEQEKVAGMEGPMSRLLRGLTDALLPLSMGFLGMFLVMFAGFAAFMLGQKNTEFTVYPYVVHAVVFGLLAGLLSYFRGRWLWNSALVCAFPVFYHLILQPVLHYYNPPEQALRQEGLMFQVIPLAVVVAFLAGYVAGRLRPVNPAPV
ncbi:MAG: hypothetical protein EP344_11990 [Bacteroidetes bacterium]|nr:MAG: hypothetical protein EP344_11990 [Bacteroidota bacterium]